MKILMQGKTAITTLDMTRDEEIEKDTPTQAEHTRIPKHQALFSWAR